jgi:MYXO-CTERM domain-containing protein
MRGFEDDSWTDITGNEAPITLYWSAEALAHENTVRFGTYGRGIWDYQFPEGPPLEVDLGDTGDAPTNLGTHDAPGAGGGSLSTCGCTTPSRSDRSSGTWALLTLLAMTRLRRRQPPSGS